MATATKSKSASAKSNSAPKKQTAQGNFEPALREFLEEEMKDLYWAEKHLTKALPKMKKAATSKELANAFGDHLEQTKVHITRLEKVFSLLGKKAQAKKCDAMEGIVKEGESIIEDTEPGTATRDVGLIIAAQKAEHYEISTYGGLRQLAETLGLTEVEALLATTLQEEKDCDVNLTVMAVDHVNYKSAHEKS